MSPEIVLPSLGRVLQARYVESRRAWCADPDNGLIPLPKRRTSKRRPVPGLLEPEMDSEG